MPAPGSLSLGLAPALTVDEPIHFGPLVIEPFGVGGADELSKVAARFAEERGAHPSCQAVVTCPGELRALVPTIWSLFVFACVSVTRRQLPSNRLIFPEHFYLLPVTETKLGLVFESGHTMGYGKAQHYPLRWPVDGPERLYQDQWDRRLEIACTMIARDPERFAKDGAVVAAGMAADLANAAVERRNQKVENVATGARTYVLLGSALEALHCKGSEDEHSHFEVVKGVDRLDPASTSLGRKVFSEDGLRRPPTPTPGSDATRPMFVAAQLVHLRNTYSHGRSVAPDAVMLPKELNGAHLIHAASMVLAALIGDDLSTALGCAVPGDTPRLAEVEARTGLPFELVHGALIDGRSLLTHLENAIVPAVEQSSGGRRSKTGAIDLADHEA